MRADTIRDYLRRGLLVGTKERGALVITVESVRALLVERETVTEERRWWRREWHERLDAFDTFAM